MIMLADAVIFVILTDSGMCWAASFARPGVQHNSSHRKDTLELVAALGGLCQCAPCSFLMLYVYQLSLLFIRFLQD